MYNYFSYSKKMTFSDEWNLVYKKNLQINNWPFSELISYTK